MSKEAVLMKEVWVPADKPFIFREAKDPHTGNQRFYLNGLILPFGKISRNNVLYNKESIKEQHKKLIGLPVMYNHNIEGNEMPRGHFIDSYTVDKPDDKHPVAGWYYKADIDPQETDLIRKLKRGDLRHVSIQLVGGRVLERVDPETNTAYSEAYVSDIIEGSITPAPGFLDTTAQFAEALHPKKALKEQVTKDPAIGAGPVIPDTQQGIDGEKPMNPSEKSCAKSENNGGGKMPRKMREQNEEPVDTQAGVASSGDQSKGTPIDAQDVGQDDQRGIIAKESDDLDKDTKAGASITPYSDKGTKPTTKSVGQDDGSGLAGENAEDTKMESRRRKERLMREQDDEEPVDDEELIEARRAYREARRMMREALRKLREAEGEDESELNEQEEEPMKPEFTEKFLEQYEDDMSKVTDIMERFKEEIDELKDKVEQLSNGKAEKDAEEEEPQAPMTESAQLRNVFTEAVKNGKSNDKTFDKSVRDVLYG